MCVVFVLFCAFESKGIFAGLMIALYSLSKLKKAFALYKHQIMMDTVKIPLISFRRDCESPTRR